MDSLGTKLALLMTSWVPPSMIEICALLTAIPIDNVGEMAPVLRVRTVARLLEAHGRMGATMIEDLQTDGFEFAVPDFYNDNDERSLVASTFRFVLSAYRNDAIASVSPLGYDGCDDIAHLRSNTLACRIASLPWAEICETIEVLAGRADGYGSIVELACDPTEEVVVRRGAAGLLDVVASLALLRHVSMTPVLLTKKMAADVCQALDKAALWIAALVEVIRSEDWNESMIRKELTRFRYDFFDVDRGPRSGSSSGGDSGVFSTDDR